MTTVYSDKIKKLVLDAFCSCKLDGVGTFFLVHESGLHLVRENGELVSYEQHKNFYQGTLFVVDEWSICLTGTQNDETVWIGGGDNWDTIWTDLSELTMSRLATLLTLYRLKTSGFSKQRAGDDFDSTIECRDGQVPVHRLVMNRKWPYFEREAKDDTLKLDLPKDVVEPLVSHLYEENKPLTFQEAIDLLPVVQVYELPELLVEVMTRIKTRGIGFEEAVVLWKVCYEIANKPLRLYCSRAIFRATGGGQDSELLKDLTQEQYSQLFADFSYVP